MLIQNSYNLLIIILATDCGWPPAANFTLVRDAGTSGLKKSKSNYEKYSPNERYNIGKHASEFGTASTLRRFKVEFPHLRESTVHSIRSKSEKELKVATKAKTRTKVYMTSWTTWKAVNVGKD